MRTKPESAPLYTVTREAVEELAGRKITDEEAARIAMAIEYSTVDDCVRDAVNQVVDLADDEEDKEVTE